MKLITNSVPLITKKINLSPPSQKSHSVLLPHHAQIHTLKQFSLSVQEQTPGSLDIGKQLLTEALSTQ